VTPFHHYHTAGFTVTSVPPDTNMAQVTQVQAPIDDGTFWGAL
jgi:hypothetical protein